MNVFSCQQIFKLILEPGLVVVELRLAVELVLDVLLFEAFNGLVARHLTVFIASQILFEGRLQRLHELAAVHLSHLLRHLKDVMLGV